MSTILNAAIGGFGMWYAYTAWGLPGVKGALLGIGVALLNLMVVAFTRE